MTKKMLLISIATAMIGVSACGQSADGNAGGPTDVQSSEAKDIAGDKTIGAGLPASGKFMAAAKAAGLDQTLAGPGPYTVFVPDDAAFSGDNAIATTPDNRAQLTGALTNLILPGTVMAEDIGKSIDAGKGKAILATMGGGTITATKEGDSIVLTDSAGHKATVTKADDKFTNGVVHHINGMLASTGSSKVAAPGQKAG